LKNIRTSKSRRQTKGGGTDQEDGRETKVNRPLKKGPAGEGTGSQRVFARMQGA